MADYYLHPNGLCESPAVGPRTRIWAFAHVMKGARIGESCNIGEGSFIEGGAVVGNHVTIKNGVAVWDRVTVEDHVFVGHNVTFINDKYPRSTELADVIKLHPAIDLSNLRRCATSSAFFSVPASSLHAPWVPAPSARSPWLRPSSLGEL